MGQSDSVQQASFDWILREASSPASVRFGWEGTRWPARQEDSLHSGSVPHVLLRGGWVCITPCIQVSALFEGQAFLRGYMGVTNHPGWLGGPGASWDLGPAELTPGRVPGRMG